MAMRISTRAAALLLAACTQGIAQTPPDAQKAATALNKLHDQPAEYVPALANYIHDFPDSDIAEGAAYNFRSIIPKTPSPDIVRPWIHQLMQAVDAAPTGLRVRVYSDLAKLALTHELFAEALEMSTKGIPLVDEGQFVEFERHRQERQVAAARVRNPGYQSRAFQASIFVARFPAFLAGYHSSQARAYLGLGRLEDADAAFLAAYRIVPSAESAWGLGDVLERRGKNAEALRYMTEAVLIGKLKPPELKHFQQAYAKLHRDDPGGVEGYLDNEYRKTYQNPIPAAKQEPFTGGAGRTVLAEFFTGGGCVPCVPFDYSFERILEKYPLDNVVVIVDHWHAPVEDPLGNHSADNRVKYYGVKGAPAVFIDGERLDTRDDNANETQTKSFAPRVFFDVERAIRARMAATPRAHLDGQATRNGGIVRISATVSDLKMSKATLQVALIEKSVSYSGENGLRFHSMVVRNLAQPVQPGKFGFEIDVNHTTASYAFDLQKITAENLRYYDEYPEERKAEIVAEGRASVVPMLEFNFREAKNVMNPANLAVVVYLQNDGSKEVLQSLFVPVDEAKGK